MIKHLVVAISIIACPVQAMAEPANLSLIKNDLSKYHDTGQYSSEFNQVITKAKHYLTQRITQNQKAVKSKKLAIVLDIDETSLSNYNYMQQRDFGGTIEQINHEIERGDAPALTTMLKFYRYAKNNHVAVFFVTGRKEPQRMITTNNLHKAGYDGWSGLYLKPTSYHQKSVTNYKAASRKEITHMGYDIVETIGDQRSDLDGGYADKGFKLPNPYYYLP